MNNTKEIDPAKKWSEICIYDGASNVQLGAILLKVHSLTLTVMRGVEHTVSLFFSELFKIPIVSQMISSHNVINTLVTFRSEYANFNHKNDPCDIDKYILCNKDIVVVIVICGARNILYHASE